ncbi:hypothetical protein QBC37DRAFT_292662 [Rhypophila decipiens]|uniref:NACHT domain-containing protein n=1 Tax=Rhypophila decipiens TaxID=261697 RepID=A0AAN6Y168_9PEZI|nr:hypothetical protein QBC37DRAFT_292662 [Rhypophila decipiens]
MRQSGKAKALRVAFFSLIQSVQQFTNIIDTYVSANPEVSALVWSSMKLTLMIIVNAVSYFDAFSKLFLRFEGLRPRFEEYSFLFPGSIRLQTALCHFHASIIKSCKEAIVISRRPWQQHVFHILFSSFQSEMTPFIEDIELKAKEVKGEITLAKAKADQDEHQLQDQERKEASRHRLQLTRLLVLSKNESPADEWSKEIHYRRNESSTLIVSGKIGAGKTVLTGAILDYLFQNGGSDASVLFYHVRFDKPESLQAETIIRSLIRQKLDTESLSVELNTLLVAAEHAMFDSASLYNLLQRKLLESKITYIIIDGVDEPSPEEVKIVTCTLKRLMGHPRIFLKLLLSSRDGRSNDLRKKFLRSSHLSLHGDGADEDIKHYITQVIDERIEEGDLVVGDKALIGEIRDALTKGAQGMFLWVALEVDDVCFQGSDAAIRAVLDDLPKDLTGTLNRAVRRILARGKQNIEVVKRILKIMAAVKRPLELAELAEAVAIEIGQAYWKHGQGLNNLDAIPAWCENLVTVDEESQSVQFIHHNVNKFLLESEPTDPELCEFHFSIEESNHLLGEICVTYLGLNDFKTEIVKRLAPLPILDPKIIATAALRSRWKGQVAENLGALVPNWNQTAATDSAQRSRVESVARLEAFRGNTSQETPQRGRGQVGVFLNYASTYWIQHTARFSKPSPYETTTDPKSWALFLQMITGTHHVAHTPWTEDEFDVDPTKVIMWADSHRHIALL